ncbi:MAG: 3-keto-disaccharide hydrolase, partial [Streptosporangiaceae bacterium]
YHDFRLHAEWRWPGKPGNGGILVHISSGPKDRVWPVCFQIQLKHGTTGDLLPMAGATFAEPLTSAPGAATPIKAHTDVDSEQPAGAWNTCDITCRDDLIDVFVNGVRQNQVTGCSVAAGRVGFQFEGTPFELRNVQLDPLN